MTARCVNCKEVFEPGPDRHPWMTTFYDGTPIDWWVCPDCKPDGSARAAKAAMEAAMKRDEKAMFGES